MRTNAKYGSNVQAIVDYIVANGPSRYTDLTKMLSFKNQCYWSRGQYVAYFCERYHFVENDYWVKNALGKWEIGPGLPKKYRNNAMKPEFFNSWVK